MLESGAEIEATERWVERVVIGLNLCPFAKAVRAKGVEAGLVGKRLDAATIEAAAQKAAEGVDVQADLQGSVEYKSHLCRVFAKRALEAAVKRAQG